jgi:hypothetical protein
MPRPPRLTVLLLAGCLGGACSRGPALAALKAADAGIEAARPSLERYVPEEFGSLANLSRAAHDSFNQGDYRAALAQAQAVPARVQAALAAAEAKKQELGRAWEEMEATLPARLETVTTRLGELSGQRRLPAGLDRAKLARARTEVDAIAQTWKEATASYEKGGMPEAVVKARTVKARLEGLMTDLGMEGGRPEPVVTPQ